MIVTLTTQPPQVMEIIEFKHEDSCTLSSIENVEIYEATRDVYAHMVSTGQWMEHSFNLVLEEVNHIKDHFQIQVRNLKEQEAPKLLAANDQTDLVKSLSDTAEAATLIQASIKHLEEKELLELDEVKTAMDTRMGKMEEQLSKLLQLAETKTVVSLKDRIEALKSIKDELSDDEYEAKRKQILDSV